MLRGKRGRDPGSVLRDPYQHEVRLRGRVLDARGLQTLVQPLSCLGVELPGPVEVLGVGQSGEGTPE